MATLIDNTDELRIYAIVSLEAYKACGGNRGKMLAQAGHAFLHTFWAAEESHPQHAMRYKYSGVAVKIALAAPDAAHVEAMALLAKASGLPHSLVTDAGRTVFPEPTVTALGIGPISKAEAPQWLKDLRPFL